MLSKLKSEPENGLLPEMLHAANLLCPDVLQLQLNAFDWQKEAVEGIVLLMDVWAEHQVDGPVALVDERKTTPRVLLIRLHATLKYPVFDHEDVCQVRCLLTEAQIGCTVV